MKDLYYVPDLSEIHIGFRYEHLEYDDVSNEELWWKYVFPEYHLCTKDEDDNPDLVEVFYSQFKQCRVKYLDQQDIEELGWVKVRSKKDHESYDRKGFKLVTSDKGLHIFKTNGNVGGDFRLFFGQIKNLNELQRLMTQLNIL